MGKLLSYIRYPFAGIGAIFFTAFYSGSIVLIAPFRTRRGEQVIIRAWGKTLLALFNVHCHVEGLEKIPPQGVLFLFNHTSHFDILIIHAVTPRICRFGAKVELFKIPLFAQAMRAAGALPIARGNRAQVFRVYQEAEARLANGESFILAPEGTRQTVADIGPFKAGPFVFAINAKVPIVPIVVEGAIDIMHKKSLLINWGTWRKDIFVRFLDPIIPSAWDLNEVGNLQNATREKMHEAFHQMRRERESKVQLCPRSEVATTNR